MTGSSWHFNQFLYINMENLDSVSQICGGVKDAMQDSFLESDSSESQPNEEGQLR